MNDHVNGTIAGILNSVGPKETPLPSVPSDALLACPFCGSTATRVYSNVCPRSYIVACTTCCARGSELPEREKAIAAWNTVPRHANAGAELRRGAP